MIRNKRMHGFFIRDLRREIGLTQIELAAELGVSDRTIRRWERNECSVPASKSAELITISRDDEKIYLIKASRPIMVRGKPFRKRGSNE